MLKIIVLSKKQSDKKVQYLKQKYDVCYGLVHNPASIESNVRSNFTCRYNKLLQKKATSNDNMIVLFFWYVFSRSIDLSYLPIRWNDFLLFLNIK